MARRYVNWKLLIVLLIGAVLVAATAVSLRHWRRTDSAENAYHSGITAFDNKEWNQAVQFLDLYLSRQPGNPDLWMKLATASLNVRPLGSSEIRQAINALRRALRQNRSDRDAALKLIGLYLQLNSSEAVLVARDYLDFSDDPEVRTMFAATLIQQHQYDQARTNLQAVIKLDPAQLRAYQLMADLSRLQPAPDRRDYTWWMDAAVENNPASADALLMRAAYLIESGDEPAALRDTMAAADMDISDPDVRLRLARILIELDEDDLAAAHLDAVHQTAPDSLQLWRHRAALAAKLADPELVRDVARNGLGSLGWQACDFMPIAAEMLISIGDHREATRLIEQLESKNIAPARVAYLRGLIARSRGLHRQSLIHWRAAIELGDQSDEVRRHLADSLAALGDKPGALRQMRSFLSDNRDSFNGQMAAAELCLQLGYWDDAATHARHALRIRNRNIDATATLAEAHIKQLIASGRPDAVLCQTIERLLNQLDSDTRGSLKSGLLRSRLIAWQRDYIGAGQLLEDLQQRYPGSMDVAVSQAALQLDLKKPDEAIQQLRTAVDLWPAEPIPQMLLAAALAEIRQFSDAAIVLRRAMGRFEDPLIRRQIVMQLAGIYLRGNRENSALSLLQSELTRFPDDIPIRRKLLSLEAVTADPALTRRIIEEIRVVEGDQGWQWKYEMARLLYLRGTFEADYPRIVELLRANLLLNPDDQNSRMLLAAAYEQAGEGQHALSLLREAVLKSPNDPEIITAAAAILHRMGEHAEADRFLEMAASKNIDTASIGSLLARSLIMRGDLPGAAEAIGNYIQAKGGNTSAYLTLAQLKMRMGELDDAETILAELARHEPLNEVIVAARAELLLRQQRPDEALTLCDQLVQHTSSAAAHIVRAGVLVTLGRSEQARRDLDSAVDLEPQNVQFWLALATFHESLGNESHAAQALQKAVSLAPGDRRVRKQALDLLSRNPLWAAQAVEMLEPQFTSNPTDSDLAVYYAHALIAARDPRSIRKAVDILGELVKTEPRRRQAWIMLAQSWLALQKPNRALDTAIYGLIYAPGDRDLMLIKARSEALRSPAAAIATLRQLLDKDYQDAEVAIMLADVYVAAGQPTDAVAILDIAIKRSSRQHSNNLLIARAVAEYKSGSRTSAVEQLQRLSVGDNAIHAVTAMAGLLRDDARADEAARHILDWFGDNTIDAPSAIRAAEVFLAIDDSRATTLSRRVLAAAHAQVGDAPEILAAMAMLDHRDNNLTDAEKLYRQVLAVQPDNVNALAGLALLLSEVSDKPQDALPLLQRGLQLAPDSIPMLDAAGTIYHKLGRYDEAVMSFEDCIFLLPENSPRLATASFRLGRALAAAGKPDKAADQILLALRLNMQSGGLSPQEIAEANKLLENSPDFRNPS